MAERKRLAPVQKVPGPDDIAVFFAVLPIVGVGAPVVREDFVFDGCRLSVEECAYDNFRDIAVVVSGDGADVVVAAFLPVAGHPDVAFVLDDERGDAGGVATAGEGAVFKLFAIARRFDKLLDVAAVFVVFVVLAHSGSVRINEGLGGYEALGGIYR